MVSKKVLANRQDISTSDANAGSSAAPANYIVTSSQADVKNYARNGDDLQIEFQDGRVQNIKGFFANGTAFHNLIFMNGGERWIADFSNAVDKGGDGVNDPLVTYEKIEDG